ncbi:DUF433 domain-containing protein [Gordonia phosphorivorans]|uniref:DUF433 domain-containing protein n=1 Tax=Gordonia phosphorivorans TaxID=1056982 RepID=A0ABV6H6K5_9ACTN
MTDPHRYVPIELDSAQVAPTINGATLDPVDVTANVLPGADPAWVHLSVPVPQLGVIEAVEVSIPRATLLKGVAAATGPVTDEWRVPADQLDAAHAEIASLRADVERLEAAATGEPEPMSAAALQAVAQTLSLLIEERSPSWYGDRAYTLMVARAFVRARIRSADDAAGRVDPRRETERADAAEVAWQDTATELAEVRAEREELAATVARVEALAVWTDPERMGDIPCVRGTRVPVDQVRDLLATCTDSEIVWHYPTCRISAVAIIRALTEETAA